MEETIAAIATPYGEGGIGIIRISGENALLIMRKIFFKGKRNNFSAYEKIDINNLNRDSDINFENRKLNYGHIVDEKGVIIDEVLCVYMKAPQTYTGEDVVEINCHGGMIPIKKTLELVFRMGARCAEPGEFTKRAFLNGCLDLTQAEAVMDLISSKSEKTYDVAISQMEGHLKEEIEKIRASLVDVLVNLTVNIDYPDEDIEEITYNNLINDLDEIKNRIYSLLNTADTGKILREGLKIAIIGKPNVGKSSLMNALLKESRAIVTDIPGTTRDTIEESLNISGIPVILTDTAGIRETDDVIESIGIEKSKLSFNQADFVMLVIDSSRELDKEDRDILSYIDEKKTLVLLNKTDLPSIVTKEDISEILPNTDILPISLKDYSGIQSIETKIESLVYQGNITQKDSVLITNARHKNLLETAYSSISDAIGISSMREPLEIIEIDVNNSYQALGEIIGVEVSDDILEEVFSRFCLGK